MLFHQLQCRYLFSANSQKIKTGPDSQLFHLYKLLLLPCWVGLNPSGVTYNTPKIRNLSPKKFGFWKTIGKTLICSCKVTLKVIMSSRKTRDYYTGFLSKGCRKFFKPKRHAEEFIMFNFFFYLVMKTTIFPLCKSSIVEYNGLNYQDH